MTFSVLVIYYASLFIYNMRHRRKASRSVVPTLWIAEYEPRKNLHVTPAAPACKANVERRVDRRRRRCCGAAAGRGKCNRPGADQNPGLTLRWRHPSHVVDGDSTANDDAVHAALRRGACDVRVRRGRPATLRAPWLPRHARPPARGFPVRGQRNCLRSTGECTLPCHERTGRGRARVLAWFVCNRDGPSLCTHAC
jgi:hypothetical protein